MLHLLQSAIIGAIENDLVKLEPEAQKFVLKELKWFCDMLFNYLNNKIPLNEDNKG